MTSVSMTVLTELIGQLLQLSKI